MGHPSEQEVRAALGARYAIVHQRSDDGMCQEYLARATSAEGTLVRLTIIPLRDDRSRRTYEAELESVQTLRHPNIVPLLDGGLRDRFVYLVRPHHEGPTLRNLLDRDGRLPVAEAVRVCRDVARAFAHAHARGLVHGQLTPDAVLLVEGSARVTGFAEFRALHQPLDLDAEFALVGNPTYLPPEAIRGQWPERSGDVYSLGVVLYQALTGAPPTARAGSAWEILRQKLLEPPPAPSRTRPELAPALDALVTKALATRAEDRCTAEELADALTQWLASPEYASAWVRLVRAIVRPRPARAPLTERHPERLADTPAPVTPRNDGPARLPGVATRDLMRLQPPGTMTPFPYRASFTAAEFAIMARGLIPSDQDGKWLIFLEDDWLYFHRSWTGFLVYQLQFSATAGRHQVVRALVCADVSQYRRDTDAQECRLVDWLIRYLLLEQDVAIPEPPDG